MSAITYDTIKVVGVPYSKLLSLEIIHFPNQHGTAKMTGLSTLCGCDGIYAEGR